MPPPQGQIAQDDNRDRQSPMGGLAGMAMEFASAGGDKGKKGKKLTKGTQLVSEFLGK